MRKKLWTFSKTARLVFCLLLITILSGLFQGCGERPHKKERGFQVSEATIQDIHSAYLSGEMTCQELVQTYLDRIKKYDKDKKLNSVFLLTFRQFRSLITNLSVYP